LLESVWKSYDLSSNYDFVLQTTICMKSYDLFCAQLFARVGDAITHTKNDLHGRVTTSPTRTILLYFLCWNIFELLHYSKYKSGQLQSFMFLWAIQFLCKVCIHLRWHENVCIQINRTIELIHIYLYNNRYSCIYLFTFIYGYIQLYTFGPLCYNF
jgi:hypothetical protein